MRRTDLTVDATLVIRVEDADGVIAVVTWDTLSLSKPILAVDSDSDEFIANLHKKLDEPDIKQVDVIADTCFGEVALWSRDLYYHNTSVYESLEILCTEFQEALEKSIKKVREAWAYEFDACED